MVMMMRILSPALTQLFFLRCRALEKASLPRADRREKGEESSQPFLTERRRSAPQTPFVLALFPPAEKEKSDTWKTPLQSSAVPAGTS